MVRQGKLFIVSAPSGAGKTTLVTAAIQKIMSEYPIKRVITYTTRAPRHGDISGQDYHFISEEEFRAKIEQGYFIEWSVAYGFYYGSPRYIVDDLAQGVSLMLVIDRLGARQIYTQLSNAILIWIYTKDMATLQERLAKRATENYEQMLHRLMLANKEVQEEAHELLYHHHVLNDCFEKALQEIVSIVFRSLK